MSIIQEIRTKAANKCGSIVLPEGNEPRIIQAAIEAQTLGIARPILLVSTEDLARVSGAHGLDVSALEHIDPNTLSQSSKLQAHLISCKHYQDYSSAEIGKALSDPLTAACCMLAIGEVDACVAGAVTSTAKVLQNGLRIVGMQKGQELLSSFMLMAFAQNTKLALHSALPFALFADCAINIDPDSDALAQIASATANSAKHLFQLRPKLAMLSFSSAGSAEHAAVDKVRLASEILKGNRQDIKVIGEVQFDAALLPTIREQKMPEMAFSTAANVYIFPDLNAGNIGYKIAERIGGAQVVGPILQGLQKPLNDLSRGADVEAIINTIALSLLQA